MTGGIAQLRAQEEWRPTPHSFEIESAVLASLMAAPAQIDKVLGRLRTEHFADPGHAALYAEMCERHEDGKPADLLSLRSRFDGTSELDHLGGVEFLERLLRYGDPKCPMLKGWSDELITLSVRRRGLAVLGDAIETLSAPETNPVNALHGYERELAQLAGEGGSTAAVIGYREATEHAKDLARAATEGRVSGIKTGYVVLDRVLGGLNPGETYIVGGRPGMGKSDLVWNIAENVARSGVPVVGFSLEMTHEQLIMRAVARRVGIPASVVRGGRMDPADLPRWNVGAAEIEDLPIIINEDAGVSVAEMRSFAHRHAPGLVVVDYMQLIRQAEPGDRYNGDTQRVGAVSNAIREMGKSLRAPVLVVAQLNRMVEGRDDKRPQLSDLKESGTIEQDADAVMFLYRHEYYLARQRPKNPEKEADWHAFMVQAKGKAEIEIAKQRMGPVTTVLLKYTPAHSLFEDWPGEELPAEFEGM